MTKREKKDLARIIVSAALLIVINFIPVDGWVRFALYLVPYLIVGFEVLKKSAVNIAHGQVFDENFLMAVATIGAFAIGEYNEACFVMIFYEVGELFEHVAVGKSRKSIASLMDIRPDTANLERDGEIEEADPDEVEIGSVIVVRPGERVPIDGEIIEGETLLDTVALTGEAVPRSARAGDAIISGCVNLTATVRVRTTKEAGESTVAKILELVENSADNKAKSEDFITRFAKYYTPVVVIGAVLLAIVPSLFDGQWTKWIHQALTFLVISCPCALVLSVPLSFFGGIGGASKNGILIKGSNYLEALSKTSAAVFDKTGTLTKGEFAVQKVEPAGMTESELLELAAYAELDSSHPIAESIRAAYGGKIDRERVTEWKNEAGKGVTAVINGERVLCGNEKLLREAGIEVGRTGVHLARNGEYAGSIKISDSVKPGAREALEALGRGGVTTIMLTGDHRSAAEEIAAEVGIDEYHAELLPQDKVSKIEEIIEKYGKTGKVLFCGDGINDAPVLARADIGVAMGAMGSDAAIEASDVVLMDDKLEKLSKAIEISRKTNRIVTENIVFALAVKAVVLALGLFGAATMWEAVFADVGVLVLCILNAMRCLRFK
ncbi:MAG: cadmium-translocating P-type ATPase [Oscillospiraceae bacterium]|nr:cadmium-translocating P-type ATPase [Oscillospiraceae bacterium]